MNNRKCRRKKPAGKRGEENQPRTSFISCIFSCIFSRLAPRPVGPNPELWMVTLVQGMPARSMQNCSAAKAPAVRSLATLPFPETRYCDRHTVAVSQIREGVSQETLNTHLHHPSKVWIRRRSGSDDGRRRAPLEQLIDAVHDNRPETHEHACERMDGAHGWSACIESMIRWP